MEPDKKPKVITVSFLRANLPEILHRIALLKERYIVTKHGHAFAKIEPVPDIVGEIRKKSKKK